MKYIDIHAHMVSRTTDDYEQMALTGCIALTEPAFWAGYDHPSPIVFADYFDRLTSFEPARAAKYGIQHYCWLCLNPKEGEDRELTRQVLELIPSFLDRPNVLGIGEIGMNRVTRNEIATFIDHVDLAVRYKQLIHIHMPHLEDKYKGTRVIVDTLVSNSHVEPARVLVDHAEEHTLVHVPIFIDHFPLFQSTQDTITETLALLTRRQFCRHLEIETYTWSVLPDDLKKSVLDSIAREYAWVLKNML